MVIALQSKEMSALSQGLCWEGTGTTVEARQGWNSGAHDVSWHLVSFSCLFFFCFLHLFICTLWFSMWLLKLGGVWQLSILSAYLAIWLIHFSSADIYYAEVYRRRRAKPGRALAWEPEPEPGRWVPLLPAWRDVHFCVALYLPVRRFPFPLPWPTVFLTGSDLRCKLIGWVFL